MTKEETIAVMKMAGFHYGLREIPLEMPQIKQPFPMPGRSWETLPIIKDYRRALHQGYNAGLYAAYEYATKNNMQDSLDKIGKLRSDADILMLGIDSAFGEY